MITYTFSKGLKKYKKIIIASHDLYQQILHLENAKNQGVVEQVEVGEAAGAEEGPHHPLLLHLVVEHVVVGAQVWGQMGVLLQ